MVGTKAGGMKAAITNKLKYGEDFYKETGRKGGKAFTDKPKGFACSHERAVEAGRKGGRISRRGKAKEKNETTQ